MKDDAISRQRAIDVARDWYEGLICGSFKGLEKRLRALPPAQPERKKGRWIDDNCSECGQYVYYGDVRNFCPNCGADMRGELE